MTRLKKVCLALAATLPVFIAATGFADDYAAISNTGMAVTGDISLDDFEIGFADGTTLAFDELVADTMEVGGVATPASVYSLAEPSDPVLLNGNRLCGEGPVTYLASWLGSDENLVIVAVFTTQDVPRSDADMCASYTYEAAQE